MKIALYALLGALALFLAMPQAAAKDNSWWKFWEQSERADRTARKDSYRNAMDARKREAIRNNNRFEALEERINGYESGEKNKNRFQNRNAHKGSKGKSRGSEQPGLDDRYNS